MGALVASIRHKGMSIGEVVRQWIGARGHKLFLAFTWLSLTLVIAVFLELAAQTFAADPAVAFTATLYIFLAMVFGVAIYHYGISLKVSTIIMLADFIRFADIWYRKLLGAVNLCSEP